MDSEDSRLIMGKLILSLFILFFFISTSSAGDIRGKGLENFHCPTDRDKSDKKFSKEGSGLKGFSVFSIEAPVPKGSDTKKSGNLAEDKEFMDSLRMFLGIGGSAAPDCFRPPSDRGVLKDE